MHTKFGLVIALTSVLLLVYTNDGFGRLGALAQQEENYHMVECVLPHYFLCDNGNCLPESHLCDGESDCGGGDDSDEDDDMCEQLSCNATTEFKCASGRCVPKEARCDRVPQCRDRSDEDDCSYPACPAGKFACANNSQCLEMTDVCDGSIDCKDGLASDELHPSPCPANVTCPSYAFKCTGTNVCALPNWMCDGENDCGDNSDEDKQNCKNFQCPEDWFRCGDDRCIPLSNVCNGVIDCKDGMASDERHPSPCPKNVTCPSDFFSCEETNICAHPHWLCDGADDCGDGSDENLQRCANTPCPEDWFRCKSQRCIPPNWRCDNGPDCPTGEDEEDCEAYFNSMQSVFIPENNTIVSYMNYTDTELEDLQRQNNETRKSATGIQFDANKPAQTESAPKLEKTPSSSASNKQNKANPISNYVNSHQKSSKPNNSQHHSSNNP